MFFWLAQALTQRRHHRHTVNFDPMYTELVSPEQYVEMYQRDYDNIESVAVVPGELGTSNFGGFVVRHKRPVYVPSLTDPAFSR